MAKRAVRAKKRTVNRTAKKQSFFERFLTFPRLAIFVFVALLIVFVHQVFLPGNDVKGASTIDSSKTKYQVLISLFADKNGNGKWDNGESCLGKTFKVTLNGVSYTRTQSINNDCPQVTLHVTKADKNNQLKLIFDTSYIKNWKLIGYTYSDGKVTKKVVKNTNVVTFHGGFGLSEGFDTGVLYDAVDFGLKAK